MTNEMLLQKGRTLWINDNAEWLIDGKTVLVCYPSDSDDNVPEKFALIFNDNQRVGVVYFMGSVDIHFLTFPEHRGKGYMSDFIRSGVIKLVEPELKATTVDRYSKDFKQVKYLTRLAGLKCLYGQEDRSEFMRRLYDKKQEKLNALCSCRSGKKYKSCCRNDDERQAEDKMRPCWGCDAYKSHTTATRCWKCGDFY